MHRLCGLIKYDDVLYWINITIYIYISNCEYFCLYYIRGFEWGGPFESDANINNEAASAQYGCLGAIFGKYVEGVGVRGGFGGGVVVGER